MYQFAFPSSWNWTGLNVILFYDAVKGVHNPIWWIVQTSTKGLRRLCFVIRLYLDGPDINVGQPR